MSEDFRRRVRTEWRRKHQTEFNKTIKQFVTDYKAEVAKLEQEFETENIKAREILYREEE